MYLYLFQHMTAWTYIAKIYYLIGCCPIFIAPSRFFFLFFPTDNINQNLSAIKLNCTSCSSASLQSVLHMNDYLNNALRISVVWSPLLQDNTNDNQHRSLRMADFHGTIISVQVLSMKPDEPSNNFRKEGYQRSANFSRKENHPQLAISVDCQITQNPILQSCNL